MSLDNRHNWVFIDKESPFDFPFYQCYSCGKILESPITGDDLFDFMVLTISSYFGGKLTP